ncbi:MAG: prepilin-type N-terminal cleavage/methylation domain-containing protein [Pseudomonadota bacterium]
MISLLKPGSFHKSGFTLIELLITLAVMSMLTTAGAYYYQNYVQATYLNVAKINAQSLRIFLADHYLQHGTYLATSEQNTYHKADLNAYFGWQPEGDKNQYTYTVTTTEQSWDIVITHTSGNWLRCEQRMQICCGPDTPEATSLACP